MSKIKLYIAISLDGFIADISGNVGFLSGDGSDPLHSGSYEAFYETIGTVVLGYTTYNQIMTELSPNHWPYQGKKTYVYTHRQLENQPEITFVHGAISDVIHDIKNEEEKDIWICGGASIVNQCIAQGPVDEITLSIIPTLLGDGIRLFAPHGTETKLTLQSTTTYNGIVDLVYTLRS